MIAGLTNFVTVLRDPVERMISLYRYRRYKVDVDVPVTMGLDEFIATRRWAKEGHAYVDTFCGRDGLDPKSDAAVAAAVENLQRFAVVGFTDRLEEFSRQMTRARRREGEHPESQREPRTPVGARRDGLVDGPAPRDLRSRPRGLRAHVRAALA